MFKEKLELLLDLNVAYDTSMDLDEAERDSQQN